MELSNKVEKNRACTKPLRRARMRRRLQPVRVVLSLGMMRRDIEWL
jgi:hypothetical protein